MPRLTNESLSLNRHFQPSLASQPVGCLLAGVLHSWTGRKWFITAYDTTHLTLGMLLHYLGKLKMQIFCRYSGHMEENANKLHFYCLCLFIHPQISIFLVFKIASFLLYWLQIKFFMSLFFYLNTFVITLWHWKFVAADVTAVFVNKLTWYSAMKTRFW